MVLTEPELVSHHINEGRCEPEVPESRCTGPAAGQTSPVLMLPSVGDTGALPHPVGSACRSRRALLCRW